jgi:nitroreductase
VVVDDPQMKESVAGFYRRAFDPYMEAQRQALDKAGRMTHSTSEIIDSSEYLSEHLHEVPVLVIPCMLDRVPDHAKQGLMAGFYGSILPAVWSFQLALRARGLGSAWTTLHLEYEAEVADLLAIPHTVSQVALLPVAYTIGEQFKPGVRRPAEEVTYINGWKGSAREDRR